MFEPRNLFPVLALVFLILALVRWLRTGRRVSPAVRTWFWIACVFGLVAWWLNRADW